MQNDYCTKDLIKCLITTLTSSLSRSGYSTQVYGRVYRCRNILIGVEKHNGNCFGVGLNSAAELNLFLPKPTSDIYVYGRDGPM